jgi:predicted acylesterase/phospholipase RssA
MRGGCVRCAGYLGVLEALKEEGIEPEIYCGSSMGAIIGAIYASGRGYEDVKPLILEQLKFRKIITFESIRGLNLVGQAKARAMLQEMFGEQLIEALPKTLWVQVTNVQTMESEILREGSLTDALAASSAFPFIAPEVTLNETTYFDGDLSSGFVATQLRQAGADVVIGLSPGKFLNFQAPAVISRLVKLVLIPLYNLRLNDLKADPVDYLFTDLGLNISQVSLGKVEYLVEHGYLTAKEKMPELKKLLKL